MWANFIKKKNINRFLSKIMSDQIQNDDPKNYERWSRSSPIPIRWFQHFSW